MIASWLDRMLYRHPFEGASARRYAEAERPAFGDLDDRLLDDLSPMLRRSTTVLDVGAGPGTFAARVASRFPELRVIALDPSGDFEAQRGRIYSVRARAEALPLDDASIDFAICLSSIRHVRDRSAALRELRRVIRPTGALWIVELDPHASATRIAAHADQLGGALLRLAFGPFVVRTAPPASAIETLARDAGWTVHARRDDPVQPVYVLELA